MKEQVKLAKVETKEEQLKLFEQNIKGGGTV